jgi:hypothetical protein
MSHQAMVIIIGLFTMVILVEQMGTAMRDTTSLTAPTLTHIHIMISLQEAHKTGHLLFITEARIAHIPVG